MEFKWKTEDDAEEGWDESAGRGRSRRRWPWFLLLTAALTVAGVWLAWQVVRQQVGETTAVLEQEVRAAHSLVAQAVATDDPELLATMLSGRNQAWTDAQKQRLTAGLLLTETPTLLGWEPQAEAAVHTITFSPELREAVLVTEQSYSPAGYTGTVSLRQTHVYRRGETHWLLSPPEPDFWGGQASVTDGDLTLTFPARDEKFALGLLREITDGLVDACRAWARGCARMPSVTVALDLAPESALLADRLPVRPTGVTEAIVLPAPSLLGKPVGEDARLALQRSYAAVVVATVLDDLSGYRCCTGRAFQEALLSARLQATNLSAWPVPVEDYAAFVDAPLTSDQLVDLWAGERLPPAVADQAYAFVRFLLEESGMSAGELQHYFLQSAGFHDWLDRIDRAAPFQEPDRWQSDWLAFLYRQANRRWGRPDSWPAADLHLVCRDEADETGLYRYRVAQQQWQPLLPLTGDYPTLVPAPGDLGVFLFDLSPRESSWFGTTWWQAGETVAFDVPGADVIWRPAYPTREDPRGRYATMLRITTDEPIPEGVALFDLAACDSGGCDWRPLPGLPRWSPDGRQLLVQTGGGEWARGARDATSWEPVRMGRVGQLFWTHSGEVGSVTTDRQEITIPGEGPAPQPITVESLLALLPEADRTGRHRVTAVVPVLERDGVFLVALARVASELERLFLVEEGGARLTPLLAVEDGSFAWMRRQALSADGRWLVLLPFGGVAASPRFILYDLQRQEAVIEARGAYFPGFRSIDWEQQGGWLARLGNQVIELTAPDGFGGNGPYRHFVTTPGLRCSAVAWVAHRQP